MKQILKFGKALLASCCFSVIYLLLLSFAMYQLDLSEGWLKGLVLACYVLSCLAGGFLAGKAVDWKRYLAGLALGLSYFALLVLLSLILQSPGLHSAGNILTKAAVCIFSGMLGAVLVKK